MSEPVKSLTDAELAEVRERLDQVLRRPAQYANAFIVSCATDIPRLLATIAELKAILADCQQDSLAYLAGVREGRRQAVEEAREHCPPDCLLAEVREGQKSALKLYHWYGVLADYYKGDCVVLASDLEEARQRAIAGLGRKEDQEFVRTHEPDVYDAVKALFFNGSA